MTFSTATTSYFALNGRLADRGHAMRTARLLGEVVSLSGKAYPPGTEIRVIGNSSLEGFIDGDWLPLRRGHFAWTT